MASYAHEGGDGRNNFGQVDTAIEPVFAEGQNAGRPRRNIRQFVRRMSKDFASKTKTLGHNLTERGNEKFRKMSGLWTGIGKHMGKSKGEEIEEDVALKMAELQQHEVGNRMSDDSAFYSSEDEDVDEEMLEQRYGENLLIGRDNRAFPVTGKRRVHRGDILWHVPQKTDGCRVFTEQTLNRKMREIRIEIRQSTDMNVKKWRVGQEGWIGETGSRVQIDNANESGDFTVEALLKNSKYGEIAMSEMADGLKSLATESRHDILSRRYKALLRKRSLAMNDDYVQHSSDGKSYGKSLSKSSSFMSVSSVQKALRGLVNLGSKFKPPNKTKTNVSSHIYDEVASDAYINVEEAGILEATMGEAEWETEKEEDSEEEDSDCLQVIADEVEGAMNESEEENENSEETEIEGDSDYIQQAIADEVEEGMEANYNSSTEEVEENSDSEEAGGWLDESNASDEQFDENNSNASSSNDNDSAYDASTPIPSARPPRRNRKIQNSGKKESKKFRKERKMVTIGVRLKKLGKAPSSLPPLQTLQSTARPSTADKVVGKASGLQRTFSSLSFNSSYSELAIRNTMSRLTRSMNGLSQQAMRRQLKLLEKGKKKSSNNNLTSLEPRGSKSFPSYDDYSLEEEMCQIRKGISRYRTPVGSYGDSSVSVIYSRSAIPSKIEKYGLLQNSSSKRTKTKRKYKWKSESNLVIIGKGRELRRVKKSLKSFASHDQKAVPLIRTGPSTQDYSDSEEDIETEEHSDDSGEDETEETDDERSRINVVEYEIGQTVVGEVSAAVYSDPPPESEESTEEDQEKEFTGDEEMGEVIEDEEGNDEVDDQKVDGDVSQMENSTDAWSTTHEEEEEESPDKKKKEKDSLGTELKHAVDDWQKKRLGEGKNEVHYDQPSELSIAKALSVSQNSPSNSEVPGFPGSVRVTPSTSQYNNSAKNEKKTASSLKLHKKTPKRNRASTATTLTAQYSVPELARFFDSYLSLRDHKPQKKKKTDSESSSWPRSRMFQSYPGKYNFHSLYGPSQSLTTIRSDEELDEFGDPIKVKKHFPGGLVRLAPSDYTTTNVSGVTTWWGDDEKRPNMQKGDSADEDLSIYTAVGSGQKSIRTLNEADIKASMSKRSIISKASLGFRAAMMYLRGDGLLLKRFMKKDYKRSGRKPFKFKGDKGVSSLKIICMRTNDKLQATAERIGSGLCPDPNCMYHACPNSTHSSSSEGDICCSCKESKSWPCTRIETPLNDTMENDTMENVTLEDVTDYLQTGERNPDIYDINVIPSVAKSARIQECPECPCQGRKFLPFFPELFEKNALVPLAERIVEFAVFEGQEKYDRLYPLYTERDEDKFTDKFVYNVILLGVAKFTVQDAFRSTMLDLESEEMLETLIKEVIRDLGKNTFAEFISKHAIAQARRQLIVKEFIKSSEPDKSPDKKDLDQEQEEIWRYTLGDRDPDKYISFCPLYPGEPRADGIIPIAIPHVDEETEKNFYQPTYIQSKIRANKLLGKVFETSYNRFRYPPSEYATASETSLAIPQAIIDERIGLEVNELLDDMVSVVVLAEEINLDLTDAAQRTSMRPHGDEVIAKEMTVEEDVLFTVNKMAWSVAISEELNQRWAEVAADGDIELDGAETDGDNDDADADNSEDKTKRSTKSDDDEQNGKVYLVYNLRIKS